MAEISYPVFGCLTGLELPEDHKEILPNIFFRNIYIDTFGATMMAFAPPDSPSQAHPAPWAAVHGGFLFKSRVEIEIANAGTLAIASPTQLMWIIAAILRLRIAAPIRIAVIAPLPFNQLKTNPKDIQAVALESSPHQLGIFDSEMVTLSDRETSWVRDMLPIAVKLIRSEQFSKAFTIFDQAQWAPTPEMGIVLVWTALEILFGASASRHKGKVISSNVSNFIGNSPSDREHAYRVVRHLYAQRGRAIHAGSSIPRADILQSFRIASVAFQKVLIDGMLPPINNAKTSVE